MNATTLLCSKETWLYEIHDNLCDVICIYHELSLNFTIFTDDALNICYIEVIFVSVIDCSEVMFSFSSHS